MTKDFEGDYADIALQVIEAGMDDVRIYLDRQQRAIDEARRENQALRDENKRLHGDLERNSKFLDEQRERLKPEGPLISKDMAYMAIDILYSCGLFNHWDLNDADDLKREVDNSFRGKYFNV
jgi:hypothetical protein